VSELLQSQLLQPININPVQPHLAESNLFILNGAGPSDLSFNEFNPLFNRNRLALVEAYKSVNTDPGNFSAHRILADSYSALPRHEIARVSELLQSQLLQPININPVQPHLAESNLFIPNGAGPSDLSFNEFNPLFNRNRLALQASGIAGTHNTFGEEVVQSGVWGPLSYSIGQFHYQTDGFRKNNDLKEDIYNVFVQGMLSYNTSVQAEFRSTEKTYGDLSLNFFPNDFLPLLRQKDETESIRLGFHHAFSPRSDLIGSFMYQDAEPRLRIYGLLDALNIKDKADDDGYSGELQYLFRLERFNIVTGAGHFYIKQKETFFTDFPPFGTSTEITKSNIHHTNLYLYSQINYPKTLTFTIGGSGDFYHGGIVNQNQFNPKFGVTWNPFSGTTLRAAIFRVFKRTLITDQTLEPTQVAGFNQFFDDADATKSWCYGVAADQKFSKNIYGGVEYSGRKLDVPFLFAMGLGPNEIHEAAWKEHLVRAYLYWTPHPWFGLSAEYQYERFDREPEFVFGTGIGVAGIRNVKTHRFPLGINFYHPSGFSAQLKATYINQEGKFQPQGSGGFIPGEDQFCIVDASISYRLPKRLGLITVGVKNLFNKSFKFQDTDIHLGTVNAALSPTIQPKRLVFGKFTLAF
jgi:outer membrane receptor protein involved in Fe transport